MNCTPSSSRQERNFPNAVNSAFVGSSLVSRGMVVALPAPAAGVAPGEDADASFFVGATTFPSTNL
jgi:hypothetical protein